MANKEKTRLSVASPKKVIQMQLREFPRSSGEVSVPSLPRVQIWSLVGELKSHKPHGWEKKKKCSPGADDSDFENEPPRERPEGFHPCPISQGQKGGCFWP